MPDIHLATEDELSEAVGLRLIQELPGFAAGLCLRRSGNGYLRSHLKAFCEIARQSPLLILTDLDTAPCPASLCAAWFGRLKQPPTLLLRVAVREIEAWLLADHAAMKRMLGSKIDPRLPSDPDLIHDPKECLLRLAQRATRDVRLDLCARPGAVARQGLAYNDRLSAFVRTDWNPERAAERSGSLRRTRQRLRAFGAVTYGNKGS